MSWFEINKKAALCGGFICEVNGSLCSVFATAAKVFQGIKGPKTKTKIIGSDAMHG